MKKRLFFNSSLSICFSLFIYFFLLLPADDFKIKGKKRQQEIVIIYRKILIISVDSTLPLVRR